MVFESVEAATNQPMVITMGNEAAAVAVDNERVDVIPVELRIEIIDLTDGLFRVIGQRGYHTLQHVVCFGRIGSGLVIADPQDMLVKYAIEGFLALPHDPDAN